LLFEEFFEGVFELSKGGSWSLKILVKIINIFLVLGVFFFILYSFITKKYFLLLTFLGLVIIAECAHFIRKTREKSINKITAKKNAGKKVVKDLINPGNSNNDFLLKSSKNKNKNLLESGKSKNKNLLKKVGELKKIEDKNKNLLGLNNIKSK